ncbi:MAG: hypothetical protein MOGMAGMI_00632 [Candidatus Omnitrophica bacterium]|nr:hypothetical protein [Candidatus Omnitrophota bacterium]
MSREENLRRLEQLRNQVRVLEDELARPEPGEHWAEGRYYTAYHVLAGMMLGFLAAASSLLFNVVGSLLIRQHPMEIIRVYLTFPLGERALSIESGAILALGCCLYLSTGVVFGVLFHLVLSRFFEGRPPVQRWGVVTAMGLALWVVNYYGVLSWLQPALFGGDWIVRLVPAWVAALTHLVFAWTLLVADDLGRFDREGHLK